MPGALAALAIAFAALSTQGASVIDPTGASYTGVAASSAYNSSYGPNNLFNLDVSAYSPGQTLTDSAEWATQGALTAYVAFQLPAAHTVTSMFFAERDSGGRPDTDQMNLASIWVSQTAAFDPANPPATSPDASLVLNGTGTRVWTEYPLATSIAGRYFLVKFVQTNGTCCNPGGTELRLGENGVTARVLAASPTAYWHLDESPGATNAVDSVGTNNAAYGATSILGSPGPRSPAFPAFSPGNTALGTTLGDATSPVAVPALNLDTNARTMTILMWVNPYDVQDQYATLLGWRDGTGADNGLLAYQDAVSKLPQLGWVWGNYGWWETTGLLIPTNQWSLAAVVVTPTNGTVYLGANGGLTKYVSPNANLPEAFDTPCSIGSEPDGSRVFNGFIDDVAIFRHPLTADQIQAIYAAGVGQVPVSITQEPVSRTNYAGGTARFTVAASGSNPSFQWKRGPAVLVDGGNISGAHTDTLVVADVSSSDATNYSCVVSSPLNSLSSATASLTVIAPPTKGYDATVLGYRPQAYWQLNEAQGAATTADWWGGYDGTPLPAAVLGVAGPQAPAFPGFTANNTALQCTVGNGNSSVVVPALNLNSATATILMWIYPIGAQAAFTSMFANRSGGYMALNYNTDAATLSMQWNYWGWDSGVLVPSDQWSLVGMSVGPTNTTVYLGTGGTLTNNSMLTTNVVMSFAGASYIGSDSGNDTRVFNGVIDDVAFFNRELSPADVAVIYAAALGQAPPPTTLQHSVTPSGLVLTWYGPWTLLQADSVTGPWSPATGVIFGKPIPMTAAKKFYRLQY